jgi:gas vesicle protein
MFKQRTSYVEFLEGMVVGGSLAAMAVFVLGTPRGKKLQKQLMENYKKLGDKAEFYLQKAAHAPIAKKMKRMAHRAVTQKSNSRRKTR